MAGTRRGLRTGIRDRVGCPKTDGGCGAKRGEPCVSYTGRNGTVNGTPQIDVHAARWRAYRRSWK